MQHYRLLYKVLAYKTYRPSSIVKAYKNKQGTDLNSLGQRSIDSCLTREEELNRLSQCTTAYDP